LNPQNKSEEIYSFPYPKRNWYSRDTIAAIATPPGKGGIGIIRISGNSALALSKSIFRKNTCSKIASSQIQSHHLYYGKIVDPENEEEIDEVMLCPMIAPKSYTREDVVEIQSHSGSAVLGKILNIILKQGVRIADPGEFTKRAFLNGRIDLTQAEAVIDIINAENESARKIATRQLSGGLKDQLIQIKSKMMESLSEIEAEIDFSEEHGESYIKASTWQKDILASLNRLEESAALGQIYKDGILIVLVGKPNVGKSSLMNRLLNQDRAIVTPFPGTTRDHIEEGFEIEGIRVRLIDTAGIHKSQNPIEILGIKKTKEIIQKAKLVLFMCDMSNQISKEDEDIFKIIHDKMKIIVFNKKILSMKTHSICSL
jgi:tRNA modification GTPase